MSRNSEHDANRALAATARDIDAARLRGLEYLHAGLSAARLEQQRARIAYEAERADIFRRLGV